MCRTGIFRLIALVAFASVFSFFSFLPPAHAGVWVNANQSTTQVSVERWVQKVVPVQVWVQSGYWDTSGTVWDPPWDQPPYYRSLRLEETIFTAGDVWIDTLYGTGGRRYVFKADGYFAKKIFSSSDKRVVEYRKPSSGNFIFNSAYTHGPAYLFRFPALVRVEYNYVNSSDPRILWRDWQLNIRKFRYFGLDWDTELFGTSPGYYVRYLRSGTPRWVDTSHWETRYETRLVKETVTLPVHGTVTISKYPAYILTKYLPGPRSYNEPAYMELNVTWNNLTVNGQPAKVTKVVAFHDIERFYNRGHVVVKPVTARMVGNNGAYFKFLYDKPGTDNSTVYVRIYFGVEGQEKYVELTMRVPVNGVYTSLGGGDKDPRLRGTPVDSETVSF